MSHHESKNTQKIICTFFRGHAPGKILFLILSVNLFLSFPYFLTGFVENRPTKSNKNFIFNLPEERGVILLPQYAHLF
jgi:hypothetical protein